jgi:LysM repeat protein
MESYNDAATKATRNTSSISSNGTYTVKTGDTLSKIADWFGVSLSDLESANNNIKSVKVGQQVNVPHYANGTDASSGNLIVKDENGYEISLSPASGGNYSWMPQNSKIFTAQATDNLKQLSQFNPQNIIAGLMTNQTSSLSSNTGSSNGMPYIDASITIQGNATDDVVNQIKSLQDSIVKKVYSAMKSNRQSAGVLKSIYNT